MYMLFVNAERELTSLLNLLRHVYVRQSFALAPRITEMFVLLRHGFDFVTFD
jgi:hypothetical protein